MTAAFAWRNGRVVPPAELTLSFADAGFVSAATVTDFCRTYRHRLFRWPTHLARFRHDCAAIRVPLPYTDAELTAAAEDLVARTAATLPAGDDLAVITFATPGPLGHFTGTENGPPTVGMHTFPLAKDRYRRFFAEGVTLALAGIYDGGFAPVAVKHRSRLHWWLADAIIRDPADPRHVPGALAVLTRPDGTAPDTAVANVLAVAGRRVLRPRAGTVLEGVSLGVVAELCEKIGCRFEESGFPFPPGNEVSELLVAGSGFGVAGVRAAVANGVRREFDWPGPVCRAIQTAWSELVGIDVVAQFVG